MRSRYNICALIITDALYYDEWLHYYRCDPVITYALPLLQIASLSRMRSCYYKCALIITDALLPLQTASLLSMSSHYYICPLIIASALLLLWIAGYGCALAIACTLSLLFTNSVITLLHKLFLLYEFRIFRVALVKGGTAIIL